MERSPLGRFVRFNRKLGSGSYKVVFLGFDNDTGAEKGSLELKLCLFKLEAIRSEM